MKILLINPPQDLDTLLGVGKAFVQKYEPLGILYIAAVLREAGYEVSVIDAYAEELSLSSLKERIKKVKPNIVGISTLTCNGDIVFELGKWIKDNLDSLVVLGNVHAAVYANEYLKESVCDIVVHGEGEYIFLEIANAYQQGSSFLNISGISVTNKSGEVSRIGDKGVIDDLTKLPLPARDLVDQSLYNLTEISNQLYLGKRGTASKTIFTSRGCPNRCIFCVVHNGQKPRFNNIGRVVDELEILEKEYKASYVFIMDSLFFADRERVLGICREIKKRDLKIKWGADAHIRFIDKEIIEVIEDAGCYELSFGIESGVQRLLDTVKKGIKLEQVRETLSLVKKHSNIKIGGLFILGIIGETYTDSLETIKFAKSLPLDIAQFSILMPYPGSPLFEELKQKGEIDTGIGENGLLDVSVWKKYSAYVSFTGKDPIWVTKDLTAKELRRLQKRAQREFYLRPRIILQNSKRLRISNIFKILRIVFKAFF